MSSISLDSKESSSEIKQWTQRRVESIDAIYTIYDALTEAGVELGDRFTDLQIPCPLNGHGPDNRPSARYYGASSKSHFYCYKCKVSHSGVSLYASLKGIKFMDALKELERRFHIKTPKRPDGPEIVAPVDRESNYVSNQWDDIQRMLILLENKLSRIKSKCSFSDYVKFCRVLDAVQFDIDKTNKSTPAMSDILKKLMNRMNDILELNQINE